MTKYITDSIQSQYPIYKQSQQTHPYGIETQSQRPRHRSTTQKSKQNKNEGTRHMHSNHQN